MCSMFRGFKGYIQADAHCVYDALFRGDARIDETDKPPDEVACWSHARRKVWEAAVVTKEPAAREALLRIQALFQLEEDWAHLAPKQRHERRQRVSRPMLDEFFAWAEGVFERVRGVRGPVATAFGYAIRQRDALRRFLDDGRLRMENNASERALRPIAVARNAWLFFGSGDHAQAAANIFSQRGEKAVDGRGGRHDRAHRHAPCAPGAARDVHVEGSAQEGGPIHAGKRSWRRGARDARGEARARVRGARGQGERGGDHVGGATRAFALRGVSARGSRSASSE